MNSYHQTGIKSPLDAAILSQQRPDIDAYQKVDEAPFDFERRRLSVVVRSGEEYLLIVKGAPESVLACCSEYETSGRTAALGGEIVSQCKQVYEGLCGDGFRVLAVAYRRVNGQQSFGVVDERELTFVGFMAFADPPLPDAARTLRALKRDGVQVKVLTGDNELVARHVCAQVGIDTSRIVLGEQLGQMS